MCCSAPCLHPAPVFAFGVCGEGGRGRQEAPKPLSSADSCTLHCANASLLSSQQIPEVKTRFSPNPSAVFQAPSRILNV